MGAVRRGVTVSVAALLLGAWTAGPASAAPIDFPAGAKYDANCDGVPLTAEPVRGDGDFTPYRMIDPKQRRLLVPTSITLVSSDPGLKARHLVPGVPISKPGTAGPGPVSCTISGQDVRGFDFTLLVTGMLT
ncbi:MAG: hypothetical protein QOK15_3145 [Nocardioidaceae bacterium]|jgi:hypothetical protein|nr:hypothetical protein [Nocardioidaceae bacterium]